MSKTMQAVIADLNLSQSMPITYSQGKIGNNYPVPAIRLEVDICQTWNNTVAIFDVEWNKIVYAISDIKPINWSM